MKKIFVFSALLACMAIGLSSCENEIFVEMTGVSISPSTLNIIDQSTAELKATITPANATSQFLVWKSSNTDIVTIDNYGRLAAKKPGTVTITASSSDGAYSGTATVNVAPIECTAISLNKSTLTLVEEDTETLSVKFTPANCSYKDVEWKTSDDKVAKVEEGKVTAVAPGEATITVTTKKDGGKTATCAVTVKYRIPDKPETLDIWKSDEAGKRAILGGTSNVTSEFLSYDASTGVVSWTENTTGKPRTATLTTGESSITVTQIGPADFVGAWSLTAKTFAPNTNLGVTANPSYTASLTIEAKEGQTAKDGDKTITNNITIAGLINSYVAEGAVDVDYAEKTFRIGIFFDGEKAQAVSTGKEGFAYVVLLPELGNAWTSGQYNFCPFPFNNKTNKGWLWFVSDSYNAMHYGRADWLKCDEKDILGLSFVAVKSSKPTEEDFAVVNAGSGYDVIYQCNVNSQDNPGFQLKR